MGITEDEHLSESLVEDLPPEYEKTLKK